MSYSVEHSDVVINDYIVSASDVPYISRNRDYTLRSEIWSLSVAMTYATVPAIGDKIEVLSDSQIIFGGEITRVQPKLDSRVYDIEVESSLGLLRTRAFDIQTIYSSLYPGSSPGWWEFTYSDVAYYDFPIVGLTYLLKTMFTFVGLTLTTSNIEDLPYVGIAATSGNFASSPSVYATPKYMFFRVDTLFNVNQSHLQPVSVLDDFTYDSGVTLFDVVSEICSQLGMTLICTSYKNYNLINTSEMGINGFAPTITTTDDQSYDKIEEEIYASAKQLVFSNNYTVKTHWVDAKTYIESTNGTGGKLEIMPNLEILISDAYDKTNHYKDEFAFTRLVMIASDDKSPSVSAVICKGLVPVTNEIATYTQAGYELVNTAAMKYKAEATSVTNKSITRPATIIDNTDVNTYTTLAENFIDLRGRLSKTLEIY